MKKALVLIDGIGTGPYMEEDIKKHPQYKKLLEIYDIFTLEYQHILDYGTVPGELSRKYADPIRFKLNSFRQKMCVSAAETLIKFLQRQYGKVDAIAHSQGTQILYKSKIHLDKVVMCGSPIGWATPTIRFIVRNDISFFPNTPTPLSCDSLINLYSSNDLVGNVPSIKANKKWAAGSKEIPFEFNTLKSHDFNDYLDFYFKVCFSIIKNT